MSADTLDLEAVYREFQPKIYRYLRHLAGSGDADDLTQAVFLKVSGALGAFRGESSLSTWIYRIATNVAHDHARAKGRWVENDSPGGESVEDLPDEAGEKADQAYIRRQMRACIRGVVEKLPENYRSVLLLSDFEELANSEIAEVLGLSLDTVKIRLHRARARLRAALECQCTFYRDDGNEFMCDRKSGA